MPILVFVSCCVFGVILSRMFVRCLGCRALYSWHGCSNGRGMLSSRPLLLCILESTVYNKGHYLRNANKTIIRDESKSRVMTFVNWRYVSKWWYVFSGTKSRVSTRRRTAQSIVVLGKFQTYTNYATITSY